MHPSWYRKTRRAGGKNQANDDRYAFKHCSTQTEGHCRMLPATSLASASVPLPRRLCVQTIGGAHPAVWHAENILRLQPLHS